MSLTYTIVPRPWTQEVLGFDTVPPFHHQTTLPSVNRVHARCGDTVECPTGDLKMAGAFPDEVRMKPT